MSYIIFVVMFGLGILMLFGFGVFALCLHAGETIASAASEASSWWIAFSVSYFFGQMALMFS